MLALLCVVFSFLRSAHGAHAQKALWFVFASADSFPVVSRSLLFDSTCGFDNANKTLSAAEKRLHL